MSSHFNDPGMDTARPEFNLNDLKDVRAERGVGAVGMASAMRRKVEGEKSPIAPTFASVMKGGIGIGVDEGPSVGSIEGEGTSGLGQGIVVEDEEEMPSRILGGESMRESQDLEEEGDTTIDGHGEEEESDAVPTIELPPVSPAAPPLPPSSEDAPASSAGDPSNSNLDQYRSHLRPNLRDFREGGTITVPGTGERRSLFMPHPGAPKPLTGGLASPSAGPMYVQRQLGTPPPPGAPPPHLPPGVPLHHPQGPYPPQGGIQSGQTPMHPGLPPPPPRPRLHVIQVLRQALSQPPPAPRPMINGRAPPPPRGPTIYGRLEVDLSGSIGPVPVVWSVEAPPTKVIQKAPLPQQQQLLPPLGVQLPGQVPVAPSPLASGQGQTPPPPIVSRDRTSARSSSASLGRMSSASAPGGVGVPGSPSNLPSVLSLREDMTRSTSPLSQSDAVGGGSRPSSSGSTGGTSTPTPAGGAGGQVGDASKPIPRANFFPKAAGMRPRSRSFSDMKSVGNGTGSG
ncbi:hypothetical protein FA13DRAFT_199757 [Coprinellus micaceus]|uniref:Uncharacterized protein n=1 Tax=Coprinellus micaceus TaxID=71717 RepID=A0A4Y7SG48_COPMI|nr:hypothetical protein FA13DRAFT_199757 [Coprinellus micaceus]